MEKGDKTHYKKQKQSAAVPSTYKPLDLAQFTVRSGVVVMVVGGGVSGED